MSNMTTTSGVANTNTGILVSEDDAANAFLSKWSDEDGASPSETAEESEEELTDKEGSEEEGTEETDDEVSSEDDHQEEDGDDEATEESDEDETTEEDEEPAKKALDDDAVVKVTVDGKDLDVSVKELKRLYGQEKALTRKSQEVAAKRKDADVAAERLGASYKRLYDKAAERFKPYAEIDMLVASKQLDTEQFAALRQEAQAAYEDFRFVSEEADGFVKAQQAEFQARQQVAAQEAIKVLKADIPSWSQSLYDEIRSYAISKGIDANVVNNMVDPVVIKMLHQSRLYEEGKKIATKKKAAVPKKVLKPTVSATVKDTKGNSKAKASTQFAKSGSVDDATNLFLARWASDEE